MCVVVVLQNCMGFVEGETGSCNETGVECDVNGTEEVGTKLEEALDIKDEIPEVITFPPIKTEQEVRLWGVCEVVAAYAFRPFIAPKRNDSSSVSPVSVTVIFLPPSMEPIHCYSVSPSPCHLAAFVMSREALSEASSISRKAKV